MTNSSEEQAKGGKMIKTDRRTNPLRKAYLFFLVLAFPSKTKGGKGCPQSRPSRWFSALSVRHDERRMVTRGIK
jgi:hypothetical protein